MLGIRETRRVAWRRQHAPQHYVGYVTVTGGGLTQQVHVTVTAVPVAVLVTPPDTTILQRRSVQLSARAVDNTGQTVPSTFMWMSSDASLASVSATGLVTSIGQVGTVIISARTGSVTGSATVRIQDTSFVATVPLGGRAFGVAVSSHDVAYVTNLDANALAKPKGLFGAARAVPPKDGAARSR